MKANSVAEVSSRISVTLSTLKTLELFWRQANCTTTWEIQVFNAVILSKLLYGLETLQFTEKSLNRINTIHAKGFRRTFDVPSTYIDRAYSNHELFNMANETMGVGEDKPPKIIPATEIVEKGRITLLGHVIRTGVGDPMFNVVFGDEFPSTIQVDNRRVGRPRDK